MKAALVSWRRPNRSDLQVQVFDDDADAAVARLDVRKPHVLLIGGDGWLTGWGEGCTLAEQIDPTY